jgi:hypothetical protein
VLVRHPGFVSVRYPSGLRRRATSAADPPGIGLGLFVVFLLINTVPMGQ